MTDPRIMVLDDHIDRTIRFSPIEQWAIPLCRKDLSQELKGPLKSLENKIKIDKMRELILQARGENYTRSAIESVARKFCKEELSLEF